jgi:hypothetical protein
MNAAATRWANWILSLIIIIASVILCQQIISNSLINQQDKNDYAELNSVKYGLLSIDEWKRQVTEILAEEINKLYLSKANERVLRKHIEVLLNTLINDVDKKIRKENADTAGGKITQTFINIFVNLDEIKKGIPEYAKAVIHEMTKPKTKRQIKALLNRELGKYSDQTFDTQGTSQLSLILFRTESRNIEDARVKLNDLISVKHDLIIKEAGLLILLAVILFAMSGFSKLPLTPSRYTFLILSLVTLLIAGVTTPTIDMEATISQMNFMLIGHPVHFENQVLYFQSKSILDVFWIMITHADIKMKLVGILLITFSIVFPVLKIISSMGYYFNFRKLRENAVIRFFVLKSGKWSMADVMVVAIFMAYIGFNGIITSQLGHLRSTDQELVILTTNATALQPGFYLFLAYTLLALILTGFLTRKPQAGTQQSMG